MSEKWRKAVQTWLVVVWLCLEYAAAQHREHKMSVHPRVPCTYPWSLSESCILVHNIVLYPDRHSWCNATPIVQVVGQPGCEPVEVQNSVCVGACFSYSIPRSEPHSPGEVAPYCDSCQPSTTSWKQVSLKCKPGQYEDDKFEKRVEIIEGCHCSSCLRHGGHGSSDASGHAESHPQPQLMDLVYNSQNHSHKDHLHLDTKTTHRLSLLLKRLSEEEDKGSLDRDTLTHVLSEIKSEDDQTVDDNLLTEDSKESEEKVDHVAVDIVKLRHILGRVNTHHRHLHAASPPQEKEPTLDVESHHLKPALPGSEISYLPDQEAPHPEEQDHAPAALI